MNAEQNALSGGRPERPPLILDFDNSVPPLSGCDIRIPLEAWQEKIRFGCSRKTFAELEHHLNGRMPAEHGCVFTGSGDYHHISFFLLKELIRKRRLAPGALDVIVCDNHPDNMRYPFGLHCGSWVRAACGLPAVRHVHVVGITSRDIAARHAWENYLEPFWRKKLTYWSLGIRAAWLGFLGRGNHARSFTATKPLLEALAPVLNKAGSVYLSVDKDVFSPGVVRTNWDQGLFGTEAVTDVIQACSGRIVGADITGDVSTYRYKGMFKQVLSRLDRQEGALNARDVDAWRQEHGKINSRLLEAMVKAWM